MEYANERYFNKAALERAQRGMIDPQPTTVEKGLIYRYGAGVENAKTGGWWLSSNEFQRVETWAKDNGLAVPLAARLLSGVLHEWGKTSVLKSNMRVLVRAEVKRPLRAYMGKGRAQSEPMKDLPGKVEATSPLLHSDGLAIVQLYIPGLDQANLDNGTLSYGAPVIYDVGASHIFGVELVPPGTTMN